VRSDNARKPVSSTTIMTPKNSASGAETDSSNRRLSECTLAPGGSGPRVARQREAIAPAAQRLDRMQLVPRVELAAQPSDQHLDDVAVALEVLVVQPLGELGLGDHIAGAQHEVLEDAVLDRKSTRLNSSHVSISYAVF